MKKPLILLLLLSSVLFAVHSPVLPQSPSRREKILIVPFQNRSSGKFRAPSAVIRDILNRSLVIFLGILPDAEVLEGGEELKAPETPPEFRRAAQDTGADYVISGRYEVRRDRRGAEEARIRMLVWSLSENAVIAEKNYASGTDIAIFDTVDSMVASSAEAVFGQKAELALLSFNNFQTGPEPCTVFLNDRKIASISNGGFFMNLNVLAGKTYQVRVSRDRDSRILFRKILSPEPGESLTISYSESAGLVQTNNVSLLDDCEGRPGTQRMAVSWFAYDDRGNGGNSDITPQPFRYSVENGRGANGTDGWLEFRGRITRTYEFGYVGMNCIFDGQTRPVDLSRFTGITLWVRGDGLTYRLFLTSTNIRDYSYYGLDLKTNPRWEKFRVPFSAFRQPDWGQSASLRDSLQCVTSLSFQTLGQPHPSVLFGADEISLYAELNTIFDAAFTGNRDAVNYFLDRGAKPDTRDDGGWTPLLFACDGGYESLAEFLLDRGADVHAKNRFGWTPFMLAAKKGNIELLKFLKARGADIDARDAQGRTALMHVSDSAHFPVLRYLLDNGADVNRATTNGFTALYYCTINNFPEGIRTLYGKGAVVDAPAVPTLMTPLMEAAMFDRREAASALLDCGAQINLINRWGWTPLHLAAERGRTQMCRLLLSRGANPRLKLRDGRDPALIARQNGHTELANLLSGR